MLSSRAVARIPLAGPATPFELVRDGGERWADWFSCCCILFVHLPEDCERELGFSCLLACYCRGCGFGVAEHNGGVGLLCSRHCQRLSFPYDCGSVPFLAGYSRFTSVPLTGTPIYIIDADAVVVACCLTVCNTVCIRNSALTRPQPHFCASSDLSELAKGRRLSLANFFRQAARILRLPIRGENSFRSLPSELAVLPQRQ